MSAHEFLSSGQVGEQFLCLARAPKNIGILDNPSGKGVAVGQCGDSIEVSLQIDNGSIADIRVLPRGCVYTLVCASVVSELARGRNLDHALEIEPQDVVAALGGLPEDHKHCARLAVNTLGEAIADYYRRISHFMLRILLATQRPEALRSFTESLTSDPEVSLDQQASGADALSAARTCPPHLVVIDHDLPDMKPLELVKELLMVNAMVNTAVMSPLPERQFHEASEGLGVLARLPTEPCRDDAIELKGKLKKVLGRSG